MFLHHQMLQDCTVFADDSGLCAIASSYIVELDGSFVICAIAPSYTAELGPLFEIVNNCNWCKMAVPMS